MTCSAKMTLALLDFISQKLYVTKVKGMKILHSINVAREKHVGQRIQKQRCKISTQKASHKHSNKVTYGNCHMASKRTKDFFFY